jgi:hypothetical protein
MVLHYLGRYTYRVAISNQRLVSLTGGQVTFRWRDSAHHNEQKLLSLSVDEFLCRFLLHILPKGFVRIRSFGFLANRKRATLLPCLAVAHGAHGAVALTCPNIATTITHKITASLTNSRHFLQGRRPYHANQKHNPAHPDTFLFRRSAEVRLLCRR